MMYLAFLLTLIFLLTLLWLYGFISANDFSLPAKDIADISKKYKKILVIFPHADDEVLSCGGLLYLLSKNSEVNWAIFTKGERGTEGAILDESLKATRVAEAQHVAKLYGVHQLHQFEYPDNEMTAYRKQVAHEVQKLMEQVRPELVITYDPSGLYGHPDHIVLSKVVTELIKTAFPETHLWYISLPQKILKKMKLPEHMANNHEFKSRRVVPTIIVFIGAVGVLKKTQALYSYKSQIHSFKNGVPVKILPLWFYTSISPYEYFYQLP